MSGTAATRSSSARHQKRRRRICQHRLRDTAGQPFAKRRVHEGTHDDHVGPVQARVFAKPARDVACGGGGGGKLIHGHINPVANERRTQIGARGALGQILLADIADDLDVGCGAQKRHAAEKALAADAPPSQATIIRAHENTSLPLGVTIVGRPLSKISILNRLLSDSHASIGVEDSDVVDARMRKKPVAEIGVTQLRRRRLTDDAGHGGVTAGFLRDAFRQLAQALVLTRQAARACRGRLASEPSFSATPTS